jgi:hypothetical protein
MWEMASDSILATSSTAGEAIKRSEPSRWKALPKPPLRLADSGTILKKLKSGKVGVEGGLGVPGDETCAQAAVGGILAGEAFGAGTNGDPRMGEGIALSRFPEQQGSARIGPQGACMNGKRRDQYHRDAVDIGAGQHPAGEGKTGLRFKHADGAEPCPADKATRQAACLLVRVANGLDGFLHRQRISLTWAPSGLRRRGGSSRR